MPGVSLLLLVAHLAAPAVGPAQDAVESPLSFEELRPLPDPVGVAGPFAGLVGSTLVVAGGANFPDGAPWSGAAKVWHERAYLLEHPEAEWQEASFRLPRPLAYGVSVEAHGGLLLVGGSDGSQCRREVHWIGRMSDSGPMECLDRIPLDGAAESEPLPPLPVSLAFSCGAIIDNRVYVAGGVESLEGDSAASQHFLVLDLRRGKISEGWQTLAWPVDASGRALAVMAAQSDGFAPSLFLFSGRDALGAGAKLLKDGWRYTPGAAIGGGKWTPLGDSPQCLMAGSAVAAGSHHLLLVGGDDGVNFGKPLEDAHPGFSAASLYTYHTLTDRWHQAGELPENAVTTRALWWQKEDGTDGVVIPSGEIRPGVRTPRVWWAQAKPLRAGLGALDVAAVVVYMLSLVAMGLYFARRERTSADFFLAGRRIPWWAAGLSIFGTQLSAITFMAVPAKVYSTDWVYLPGSFMILAVAPLIVKVYLPFFRRLKSATAYEYLESRFDLKTRLLGAASFLLFQLGRMGIVLYLPALALATVTGVDVYACILLMGVLATIYTVLGGLEAVIWTDVVQVVVLLVGAGVSLFLLIGGTDGGVSGLFSAGLEAGKFRTAVWTMDATTTAIWVVVFGRLIENLIPYSADQTVVQRYLATPDEKSAARSVWTNAWLSVPATLVFFLVGTALWAFYRSHPERLNPFGKSDDVFAWFIASELPAGLGGLVIAGLFAAAMSSLDSSMNSIASVVTHDFYKRFRPEAPDRRCLSLGRWITLLTGVVGTGFALFMAALESTSMWDNYSKVVGLLGSGLAGLFLAGMLTRRATGTGMCLGFVASAAVLIWVRADFNLHFMLYPAIGLLTCGVVGWVASLWVGRPSLQSSA